jgi:uncharacterized membrane protein
MSERAWSDTTAPEPGCDLRKEAQLHLALLQAGRPCAWRGQIDATTNLAIGTTAATIGSTRVAADPQRQVLVVVGTVVVSGLMLLEARRYRHYAEVRRQLRRLEAGVRHPDRWQGEEIPSLHAAVEWRLRRAYIWLYGALLLTWLALLGLAVKDGPPAKVLLFRAAIGPVLIWPVRLAGLLVTAVPLLLALRSVFAPVGRAE